MHVVRGVIVVVGVLEVHGGGVRPGFVRVGEALGLRGCSFGLGGAGRGVVHLVLARFDRTLKAAEVVLTLVVIRLWRHLIRVRMALLVSHFISFLRSLLRSLLMDFLARVHRDFTVLLLTFMAVIFARLALDQVR